MKLSALLILFLILFRPAYSQDDEDSVTETYYDKWKVTHLTKEFYVNVHKSDKQDTGKGGVTILYFPLTMIDDGIFGSMGIVFSKEKKPEYIFELSFPTGIGNKNYGDLSSPNIEMSVLLISGREPVLNSVCYENLQDEITVKGVAFKSRLYRFKLNREELERMESRDLDSLQINFKGKLSKSKSKKKLPVAGQIVSKNEMIHKFSSFANSIDKVSIAEMN